MAWRGHEIWHCEGRGSKAENSDNRYGTEGVGIEVVVFSELAGSDASGGVM